MKIKVMPIDSFQSKKGYTITNCIMQNPDGTTALIKVIGKESYTPNKSQEVEVAAPRAYFAR